jgi:ribonuclease G
MKSVENKKLIYKTIKDEMSHDKAKFTILPLSKFGLMQITRERVRPEMNIATKEVCPTCNGTGKISASILVSDQIEKTIDHLLTKQNEKDLILAVHPYLYAYFTKGIFSQRVRWYMKYKRWVKMEKDTSLAIIEFKFLNKEGEEIQLTS